MPPRCLPLLCLAAVVSAPFARGDDLDRLSTAEAQAYRLIVPAEAETKWRRIPWTRDLEAAVRTAKKESRPLLLWVSGDEPLERC